MRYSNPRFPLTLTTFVHLDEGQAHLLELSKLAEKDPEFYKYLQENDRELLEFNPDAGGEDEDMADEDMGGEEEKTPTLTKEHLRQWQKALLEVYPPALINCGLTLIPSENPQHRSLRALRKLLIAFRAAAHMNEDDQVVAWSISSSSGTQYPFLPFLWLSKGKAQLRCSL